MTHYVADLERIEGRWVGFVRGLPGCFASDLSRDTCIALLPNAIDRFSVWTGSLGESDATEITIGEVHDAWLLHADYEVNAFFAVDREPLTTAAVSDGLRLLDRSYADLEVVVGGTTGVDLSREVEDGWSIERILNHIASAEWWYLDRLDLAPPRESLPPQIVERLGYVHHCLIECLLSLVGSDLVTSRQTEVWTPRTSFCAAPSGTSVTTRSTRCGSSSSCGLPSDQVGSQRRTSRSGSM